MVSSNWLSAIEYDSINDLSHIFKLVEGSKWNEVNKCCQGRKSQIDKFIMKRGSDRSIVWRRLPIHEASMRNPTKQVIMSLIDAYPNGVRVADNLGRLALHHAVVHGASEEVVLALIMAYPDSLDVDDMWGKNALSNANASIRGDKNAIVKILEKRPTYYAEKLANDKHKSIASNQKEEFESRFAVSKKKHASVVSKFELCLEKETSKSKSLTENLLIERSNVNDLKCEVIRLSNLVLNIPRLVSKVNEQEKSIASLQDMEKKMESVIDNLTENKMSTTQENSSLEETVKDLVSIMKEKENSWNQAMEEKEISLTTIVKDMKNTWSKTMEEKENSTKQAMEERELFWNKLTKEKDAVIKEKEDLLEKNGGIIEENDAIIDEKDFILGETIKVKEVLQEKIQQMDTKINDLNRDIRNLKEQAEEDASFIGSVDVQIRSFEKLITQLTLGKSKLEMKYDDLMGKFQLASSTVNSIIAEQSILQEQVRNQHLKITNVSDEHSKIADVFLKQEELITAAKCDSEKLVDVISHQQLTLANVFVDMKI